MKEDKIVQVVLKMTKDYGRLQSALILMLFASLFSTVIILAFSFLLLQSLSPSEILVALFAPLALLTAAGFGLRSFIKMIQQREEKLQQMVTVDPLTGAFNQQAFLAIGQKEWSRAHRHNYELSTLVVDFSELADKGDKIIQGLVITLTNSIRTSDTIARSAEHEFSIILTETAGAGQQVVVERINNNAKRYLNTSQTHFGLSIGASSRNENTESFAAMLKTARDNALNMKKQDQTAVPS